MTIHLYAEHLVHIRALSIQASLCTVSNQATRATLSADGSALSLAHEGEVATICLPVRVHVPGAHNDVPLTMPSAPTKDLSFRVSLPNKSHSTGLLTDTSLESRNVVPWSAPSMTADTAIACRGCRSEVVSRGQIRAWKDLPSENWAEMMDFWHCHRPDVPHDCDHKVAVKGYGADSKLALQSGVGMVDPTDFVLVSEDCSNLKVSSSASSTSADDQLLCCNCDTCIGHVHFSTGGYKLRKAYTSLSTAVEAPFVSYESEKWLACQLLTSMETQGVRKFTIRSHRNTELALKAWIFTPDINVSSSAASDDRPVRALKLLSSECTAYTEQTGALNRQTMSEGELELRETEMRSLRDLLVKSSSLLPESARKFQSWNVSLLRRFTDADIAFEGA
ncbi:hypothetical protein DOTSEDRAFT_162591 [Dothistroma septosporum NZE10]|uniref:Ubiquitin-conjugating enzyme E2C-binding protein n=1 Tax=Dothistroma septosporum (strain NZE10 / CBS 128990) TaxID=675120 RepID=N1PZE3_DOTSN|nr:hypothetical protein DOTSEDRAFT_162591 [Dothistroma septosporum NZE10]